jgi:hypothetical protein
MLHESLCGCARRFPRTNPAYDSSKGEWIPRSSCGRGEWLAWLAEQDRERKRKRLPGPERVCRVSSANPLLGSLYHVNTTRLFLLQSAQINLFLIVTYFLRNNLLLDLVLKFRMNNTCLVDDIVVEILRHISDTDYASLRALALTCCTFRDRALDCLWENPPHIYYLACLMTEGTWHFVDPESKLSLVSFIYTEC